MDNNSGSGVKKIIVFTNLNLFVYFTGFLYAYFREKYVDLEIDVYAESEVEAVLECMDEKCVVAVLFWVYFEEKYPDFFVNNIENAESVKDNIDILVEELMRNPLLLREKYSGKIFWVGFEFFCGRNRQALWEINNQITALDYRLSLSMEQEEIDIISLSDLIAKMGVEHIINEKGKYRYNIPYKKELFEVVAHEVYRRTEILSGNYIKCIVLDCDDVLWKGTIDSEGVTGICLSDFGIGKKYKDFQRYLKLLFDNGVLLALCTKNDEKDISYVLDNNLDMVLKKENLVAVYANWEEKNKNISLLASLLNIDYKDMLFIDDSQYEIDLVRNSIKNINTLLFDIDSVYNNISRYKFPHRLQYGTVITRNLTYKNNLQRRVVQKNCNSADEYIENLKVKVDIRKAEPLEFKRISELSLRTNKCSNLTRYSYEDLKKKVMEEDYNVCSVYVSDRFGDLGLVGAFSVYQGCLELFCISCRALGRKIENRLVEYILSNYKIQEVKFILNGKNGELYELIQEVFAINEHGVMN